MVSLRSIATALVTTALFACPSIAHSTERNPVDYISLVDDLVIRAPSHRVNAHSSFDLFFSLHDGRTPVRLSLEPNYDILHNDMAITYLGPDGRPREVEPVRRDAHRVYRGRAWVQGVSGTDWTQAGWARVTVHRDGAHPIFEGAFRVFGDTHHVQTGTSYRKLKHAEDPAIQGAPDGREVMVVYRDSDIVRPPAQGGDARLRRRFEEETAAVCDSDSLPFNGRYDLERRDLRRPPPNLRSISARSLFGRQSIDGGGGLEAGANYIPDIGSTDGCPDTRRVALVGIATDCNYWKDFDGDREALRSNVIDVVNRASALYEDTFKISLGIRNLTVIDHACNAAGTESAQWNLECSDSTDLSDRLNLFSAWRGENRDTNAYWTLLTTCRTGSAVGLAWRGQLCREGASAASDSDGSNETVAAANVVVRTSAEWQIFAHETGHTFGAVHDCTDATCPVSSESQQCCPLSADSCDAQGQYIMNPSTGDGISEFSPCSIGNICSGLSANVDSECLTDNRNVGTITGSQCGNGIVEQGEDCDCGGSDGCEDNDCCDPDTCQFRDGAQCDPTNEDCCTDSCRFASSGTVCRASSGACDPEETCPGNSGSCPHNQQRSDGDSCGDGLHCASGQCTSRDMQCRSMLGGSSRGSGVSNSSIRACGVDDSCMLTCSMPVNGTDQCSRFNQNFLDGTSCGGGGRCNNGVCSGDSSLGRFSQWFHDNRHIAIPVGSVIGGLLVLAISCCVFTRCRRRRRARRRAKKPASPNMSGGSGSLLYPPGPPGPGPVSAGAAPPPHPQQPPPMYDAYTQPPPGYSYPPIPREQGGRWQRTGSMRYA